MPDYTLVNGLLGDVDEPTKSSGVVPTSGGSLVGDLLTDIPDVSGPIYEDPEITAITERVQKKQEDKDVVGYLTLPGLSPFSPLLGGFTGQTFKIRTPTDASTPEEIQMYQRWLQSEQGKEKPIADIALATSGAVQGFSGVGKGMNYLSKRLLGMETVDPKFTKYMEIVAQGMDPGDAGFVPDLIRGAGNMAPYIAAALTTGGILSGIGAGPLLTAISSATGAGVLEASTEAGEAYETARTSGVSEATAMNRADKVFAANVAVNTVLSPFGPFGDKGTFLKRVLVKAMLEGGQEAWQSKIQRAVQESGYDMSTFVTNVLSPFNITENDLYSGAIGAVIGGGFGAMTASPTPTVPTPEIVDEAVNADLIARKLAQDFAFSPEDIADNQAAANFIGPSIPQVMGPPRPMTVEELDGTKIEEPAVSAPPSEVAPQTAEQVIAETEDEEYMSEEETQEYLRDLATATVMRQHGASVEDIQQELRDTKRATRLRKAIATGTVPQNIVTMHDEPVIYRTKDANNAAVHQAKQRGIISIPHKIPGTKEAVLATLEEDRIITPRGKEGYIKEATAKRAQASYAKQGITTEIVPVGPAGPEQAYGLHVIGYDRKSYNKRKAELLKESKPRKGSKKSKTQESATVETVVKETVPAETKTIRRKKGDTSDRIAAQQEFLNDATEVIPENIAAVPRDTAIIEQVNKAPEPKVKALSFDENAAAIFGELQERGRLGRDIPRGRGEITVEDEFKLGNIKSVDDVKQTLLKVFQVKEKATKSMSAGGITTLGSGLNPFGSHNPEVVQFYSGLTLDPRIIRRINILSAQLGVSPREYLKAKGYSDVETDYIVDQMYQFEQHTQPAPTVPSATKNPSYGRRTRKSLIKEIKSMAIANGLAEIKKIQKPSYAKMTRDERTATLIQVGAVKTAKEAGQLTSREANQMLAEAGYKGNSKELVFTGGWNSYVQNILGNPWSEDLDLASLMKLQQSLARVYQMKGRVVESERGSGLPYTDYVLKALGSLPKKFKPSWLDPALYVFDQVPALKELIYRPLSRAFAAYTTALNSYGEQLSQSMKDLKIGKKERERIGDYSLWQQPEAHKALRRMGIKKPKLTRNEAIMYSKFRNIFDELFVELNKARVRMGKQPLPYVSNYFTMYRIMDDSTTKGQSLLTMPLNVFNKAVVKSTKFDHDRNRTDNDIPLYRDSLKVALSYIERASRHTHVGPALYRANRLIHHKWDLNAIRDKFGVTAVPHELVNDTKFNLVQHSPELSDWLIGYINSVAGVNMDSALARNLGAVSRWMRRNTALALIAFNVRSAAIQPTALKNVLQEVSVADLLGGIKDYTKGKRAKTDSMIIRNMETALFDSENNLRSIERNSAVTKLDNFNNHALRVGTWALRELDAMTANIAWHAGYRQAERNHPSWSDTRKKNYADDLVIRTQASGHPLHRSKIQQRELGRLVTALQTFVINDFAFLRRRVAGLDRNQRTITPKAMRQIIKYMLIAEIFNFLWADMPEWIMNALGYEDTEFYAPFSVPISTGIKEAYKLSQSDMRVKDFISGTWNVFTEFAEPVPILGGAARYGSGIGGAAVDAISRIMSLHKKPYITSQDLKAAGIVIGVPGTAQGVKLYKSLKRDKGSRSNSSNFR